VAINFLELERQDCKKSHDNMNNYPLPESAESEPLSFSLCFVCGSNQELHQPARIKQLTFDPTTMPINLSRMLNPSNLSNNHEFINLSIIKIVRN